MTLNNKIKTSKLALLQEQVHRGIEHNNSMDKYAGAVKKDGKNSWASTIKRKWKIYKNDFLFPLS